MFSRRASLERTPSPFALWLEGEIAALRRSGRPLWDLTVSNPTQAELSADGEALGRALASADPSEYVPECLGRRSARRAVRELWRSRGIETHEDRIALLASTSEAYSSLFKLFCDPGDVVLAPRPSYPLLDELARYDGVQLSHYRLGYDGAWHIDFDSLERALEQWAQRGQRVRVIVVVTPNNPTGSRLSHGELARLLSYGLPIVSDEVFGDYALSTRDVVPSVLCAAPRGLVVALDGLSKSAALPQLKLAWATFAGDEAQVAEALRRFEFILDTYLSAAGPVQSALPALLALGRARAERIRARLRTNLGRLDAALAGTAVGRLDVEAGWYAVLQLPQIQSEEHWIRDLLSRAQVLVQPGWFFDFEREPYAVVSLLTPEFVFAEGIERLLAHVEEAL